MGCRWWWRKWNEQGCLSNVRGFDYFYGHNNHVSGHYHYPANSRGGGSKYLEISENEKEIFSSSVRSGLENCYAYSTDLFGARAKKWIIDNDPTKTQKPFFLFLTLTAPHASLRVPPSSYPRGGGITGGLQWTYLADGTGTCNTSTKELAEAAGAEWKGRDSFIHPDNQIFQGNTNQRHSTLVRRVDDLVGDLRQLLKDMAIDENTVIVFTSDNGPHNETGIDAGGLGAQDPTYFKTYGMMDGIKRDCHEGGIREPTIVCWPSKIKAGSTSLRPSQFQDWMATFAQIAGVPVPASSSGVSLLSDLKGQKSPLDSDIYIEYTFNGNGASYGDYLEKNRSKTLVNQHVVYVDGFKGFVRGLNQNTSIQNLTFEIYDTKIDPQESKNLAGTTIDRMNNLQARMREKLLQTRRALDGTASSCSYFENMNNAIPPNPPIVARAGLNWKIYTQEKSFPWVPDFRQIHQDALVAGTTAKQGLIMPEEAKSQSDAVGVSFEGYIEIPQDGEYVFYLKTDPTVGSKAFAHLHEVMPLVDADKLYTSGTEQSSYMNVGTEKSVGTKKLFLKKGKHPIRIGYITVAGNKDANLTMLWEKPNGAKEVVPANAFFSASNFGVEQTNLNFTNRESEIVLALNAGEGSLEDCVVSTNVDWIHASLDAVTGKLSIFVDRNTTTLRRTGTIIIKNEKTGETQTIIVNQAGTQSYEDWMETESSLTPAKNAEDLLKMEPMSSCMEDGISNLMKYALGLDPKKRYGTLGTLSDEAGVLKLTYPYNTATKNLVYIAEAWDEATQTWTSESVDLNQDATMGELTLTSKTPSSNLKSITPRQFLRLRVGLKKE